MNTLPVVQKEKKAVGRPRKYEFADLDHQAYMKKWRETNREAHNAYQKLWQRQKAKAKREALGCQL
jgi:hypothetical protein